LLELTENHVVQRVSSRQVRQKCHFFLVFCQDKSDFMVHERLRALCHSLITAYCFLNLFRVLCIMQFLVRMAIMDYFINSYGV